MKTFAFMSEPVNGVSDVTVRRESQNSVVIRTKLPLEDDQLKDLYWITLAMMNTGMRLKDLIGVVRCKDCKNHECTDMYGDWVCEIDGSHRSPDWFCADGVKKDE